MSADYEVHAALQADLLDEARTALRDLLEEHRALKSAVLQLAVEAMGFEADADQPGRYVRHWSSTFGLSFGLSLERVNELLTPFGFPGLVRVEP